MMLFSVQTVQIVQAPSLNFLPGVAGEEVGVERFEQLEPFELFRFTAAAVARHLQSV